jgi:hypothetical protein
MIPLELLVLEALESPMRVMALVPVFLEIILVVDPSPFALR